MSNKFKIHQLELKHTNRKLSFSLFELDVNKYDYKQI